MSHFRYVLTHRVFASWFAQVNPFFWPVLYWQMSRVIRWMEDTGHADLLVQIHWWGGITIVYTGDKKPDPDAYRPIPRTFRPLTDEGWGSDLPACLDSLTVAAQRALILPGRWPEGPAGALYTLTPKTSWHPSRSSPAGGDRVRR